MGADLVSLAAAPDAVPDLPPGFTLDEPAQSVPTEPAPANRAPSAPAKASSPAPEDLPPLPKGFVADPVPITDSGKTMGFADEAPVEASKQLAPEDEANFYKMLRGDGVPRASADDLRKFVASKGMSLDNADAIVAARDKGAVNGSISYPLPKPAEDDGALNAGARGAATGLTVGAYPRLQALGDATKGLLRCDGFDYSGALDRVRGREVSDEEIHPVAHIAGELLGGLALPVGLEKSGLTASMEAVGLAAGRDALREGLSMPEARAIAARAITKRLATEGAAYGGTYGANDSYGTPGERLLSTGVGAIEGAALPLGARAFAPVLKPIVNAPIRAANAAYGLGAKALSPITKSGASDRVAGILRDNATRPLADILSDIRTAPDPVEGVQPTLAEVANDHGLAGLQRGHANTDPNTGAALSERNAANALARTGAASGAMGDGSPQAIQDVAARGLSDAERGTAAQQAGRQAAADARLTADQHTAAAARSTAHAGVAEAIEKLGSLADRDATGSAARDAFDTAHEAAKQTTREAYANPVLTKAVPITIPQGVFLKLRNAADDFYGDGGGEIPGKLQSILNDMADPNATTRTLTNIDRRLADFAGEARMQGRRSEAAFAESVRSNLGEFVQKAASPEYRAALANAKAARAEQGRVFETGDAATTFTRDRFGNPTTGDNTVPTKLARPGAAGGDTAEGLIRAIGPKNAETIVRQEIRRVADERGVETEDQTRALVVRYGEAARRFPAVRADLQALQARAAELDAAKAGHMAAARARPSADEVAAIKERSALHAALLNSPLGRVADAAVDPGSFITGLLKRADGGRQLRYLAGQIRSDPAAQNGLRRALGDFIVDAGAGPNFTAAGDPIPSINKTRAAIATVITRSGDTLTTPQKIVLKQVQRELEKANFAATASKPAGSDTAMNQSFKTMMSLVPGAGKAKFLLAKVFDALGNGAQVKQLITQSLLDPDFAATLLKRPTEHHWLQVRDVLAGRKAGVAAISAAHSSDVPAFIRGAAAQSPGRAAAADDVEDRRHVPPDQRGQHYEGR